MTHYDGVVYSAVDFAFTFPLCQTALVKSGPSSIFHPPLHAYEGGGGNPRRWTRKRTSNLQRKQKRSRRRTKKADSHSYCYLDPRENHQTKRRYRLAFHSLHASSIQTWHPYKLKISGIKFEGRKENIHTLERKVDQVVWKEERINNQTINRAIKPSTNTKKKKNLRANFLTAKYHLCKLFLFSWKKIKQSNNQAIPLWLKSRGVLHFLHQRFTFQNGADNSAKKVSIKQPSNRSMVEKPWSSAVFPPGFHVSKWCRKFRKKIPRINHIRKLFNSESAHSPGPLHRSWAAAGDWQTPVACPWTWSVCSGWGWTVERTLPGPGETKKTRREKRHWYYCRVGS